MSNNIALNIFLTSSDDMENLVVFIMSFKSPSFILKEIFGSISGIQGNEDASNVFNVYIALFFFTVI